MRPHTLVTALLLACGGPMARVAALSLGVIRGCAYLKTVVTSALQMQYQTLVPSAVKALRALLDGYSVADDLRLRASMLILDRAGVMATDTADLPDEL